jgi:hypothetical protein
MKDILEKIKARVKVNPDTGCWEWQGPRLKAGYGTCTVKSRKEEGERHCLTHRAMWNAVHGEIPGGMFVCHTCDNPPCCNPEHLFLGKPKDNTADMIRKGRYRKPVVTEETRRKIGQSHKGIFAGEKNYFYKNPRPAEEIRENNRKKQLRSKGYFWQEKNKRWRVSWTCADGKRRSWMMKTEQEAIDKVARLKKELMDG